MLLLKKSDVAIVGHLHSLWHAAAEHSPAGWDASDVKLAARWRGPAQKFFDALFEVSLLERDEQSNELVIHEQHDYVGRWLAERASERERSKRRRADARAERERAKQESAAAKAATDLLTKPAAEVDAQGSTAGRPPVDHPETETESESEDRITHTRAPRPPPPVTTFHLVQAEAEPKSVEELLALPYAGQRLGEHLARRFAHLDGAGGRLHWREVVDGIFIYWSTQMGRADTRRRWVLAELAGKVVDQMSRKHGAAKGDAQRDANQAARAARDAAGGFARPGSREAMVAAAAADEATGESDRKRLWERWRELKNRVEMKRPDLKFPAFEAWRASGCPVDFELDDPDAPVGDPGRPAVEEPVADIVKRVAAGARAS